MRVPASVPVTGVFEYNTPKDTTRRGNYPEAIKTLSCHSASLTIEDKYMVTMGP